MMASTRSDIDSRLNSLCETLARTSGMEEYASLLSQIAEARQQLGHVLLERDKALRPLIYGLEEIEKTSVHPQPPVKKSDVVPMPRRVAPVRQQLRFDPVATALAIGDLEREADELARTLATAEAMPIQEQTTARLLEIHRAKGKLLLARDRHFRPQAYRK